MELLTSGSDDLSYFCYCLAFTGVDYYNNDFHYYYYYYYHSELSGLSGGRCLERESAEFAPGCEAHWDNRRFLSFV